MQRWLTLALAFLITLPAQADIIGHWRFESDATLLDDSYTSDPGGAQNVTRAGGNSASIVANADRPGPLIFDPISSSTVANNGSVTGITSNDGTSSPALIRASQAVFQGLNSSFTYELFYKVDDLTLNNGSATIVRQYSNTGDSGFHAGWINQLQPNAGTPQLRTSVDLIDGDNVDDAVASMPFSTVNFLDGNWHHLAYVYERSGDGTTDTWTYYVDYVHVATDTFNTSANDFDRNFNIDIGTTFITGPTGGNPPNTITFLIDEARYSDSVMNPDDFLRAIPEPATAWMLLLGAVVPLIVRRRVRAHSSP